MACFRRLLVPLRARRVRICRLSFPESQIQRMAPGLCRAALGFRAPKMGVRLAVFFTRFPKTVPKGPVLNWRASYRFCLGVGSLRVVNIRVVQATV